MTAIAGAYTLFRLALNRLGLVVRLYITKVDLLQKNCVTYLGPADITGQSLGVQYSVMDP